MHSFFYEKNHDHCGGTESDLRRIDFNEFDTLFYSGLDGEYIHPDFEQVEDYWFCVRCGCKGILIRGEQI